MGHGMGQRISFKIRPNYFGHKTKKSSETMVVSELLWLVAPKKISQDFQKNPLVTRLFRTFLYSFLPSSFAIGGISCLFNCVQKKIPVRIDVFPIFKTRVAGFKSGNLFTKIIDFLEIILSIRYNNV